MPKSNVKAPPVDYAVWWYAKMVFDKGANAWSIDKSRIEIDLIEFLDFLYEHGFRYTKIYENGVLFRITNNRILEEIETAQVRQFVVKWINTLPEIIQCNSRDGELTATIPRKMLMAKIIAGVGYFFDTKKLEAYLGPKETFDFCYDGRNHKYAYFRNGFLMINGKGIEFMDYQELPGYIWSSEIIQHDFDMALAKDPKDSGQVKRFFDLVANGAMPEKPTAEQLDQRGKRVTDLCIIAGYLAHSFNKYKLKALLLTDARISENSEPNGRSGKTLFMRLIGGFLCADPISPGQKTFVEIAGKNFDPTDKFRYDKASHETKLICINDLKRNFNPEWLFNDITDGLEVNKKNQQPFMLLVKMAILTNLPMNLPGDSNLDRFVVFEFSDYFNRLHSPIKEFNNMFLTDQWSPADWNQYYYFIARCVLTFFQNHCELPNPELINYSHRNLMQQVGADLMEFIEEDWQPLAGDWYDIKEVFKRFQDQNPGNEKLAQRKFTDKVQKYMNECGKYKKYSKLENLKKERDGQRKIRFISLVEKTPFDD
jgi:hypothetical protein